MKNILITGANRGIGFALCEAVLSRDEDTVVFLCARDPKRGLDAVAALLNRNDNWQKRLHSITLDVSHDASVKNAAGAVRARLGDGQLYGIVNNAGIGFGNFSMEQVLDVNCRGIRRVFNAFLPLLKPGGRIVNITAAAGPDFNAHCSPEWQNFFVKDDLTWEELDALVIKAVSLASANDDAAFASMGLNTMTPYRFSKACANALTMVLARDNPKYNINACNPGFIETDLSHAYAEEMGKLANTFPMRPPLEGTISPMHLLFGDLDCNGRFMARIGRFFLLLGVLKIQKSIGRDG